MGTRAWVIISHGGVWRAIDDLRIERLRTGGDSHVHKCFLHVGDRVDGKGGGQAAWVTQGNSEADF